MRNRSLILTLLALLIAAGAAWAMNAWYSSGDAGISVTQANTNTPFIDNHSGGSASAFEATNGYVHSRSTSANACFFDLGDGVATSADLRVEPGATVPFRYDFMLGGDGWAAIGMICKAGETATFDVVAGR